MERRFLILIFVIFSGLASFGQSGPQNTITVYKVDLDYLMGCETGKGECKPLIIKRKSILDGLAVVFPKGGTMTDVYLYTESSFTKWMAGSPKDEPKPLRHIHKEADEGEPIMDISELPDGIYHPHYLGCGVGGGFELRIVTKKK